MIRELVEVGMGLVKAEMKKDLKPEAQKAAESRLLDLLLPPQSPRPQRVFRPTDPRAGDEGPALNVPLDDSEARTRAILQKKLEAGELDDREIDVEVRETGKTAMMQVFTNTGLEELGVNFQEMFGKLAPQRTKRRKTTVAEARTLIEAEELENLLDMDLVVKRAVERTENAGIVFLDEIDKIAGRGSRGHGPDVSREGVQRDILPIVEGSTVPTKYGPVRTDHILFIAAGAFHMTKVSDLIPELQGRFPIRVELKALEKADFARILREPKSSLLKQYQAMLETEGVTVEFSDAAVEAIARISQEVNEQTENIGARRLHTIMEFLLEDVSFGGPEYAGKTVVIDAPQVEERLEKIIESRDLSKYIL
jgi:ATP-dependent HslUV protease ATP-binding subunit HslU